MTDINEILKEYVTLDIECIDRIYLNGYIPTLQMGGQLVKFIHHRGYEIPSPAILRQWTDAYKRAVESFAQAQGIEIIHFEKGTRTNRNIKPNDTHCRNGLRNLLEA